MIGICIWCKSLFQFRFFLNKEKYIEEDDYVLDDSAYSISSFLISLFKNPSNY